VLARVLPQVTAQHLAAGITDPTGAALYARTYAAFRRRRSLLLLDLQHQVRLSELPWVTALDAFRQRDDQSAAAAAAALREVVLLALTAFPHAILPNPLVRELGALATRAGLRLPLVEEVAADIFMGTFTVKWRAAAEVASRTLDGTVYARYYDLPPVAAWQQRAREPLGLRQRLRAAWKKETAEDFAALCRSRAHEAGGPGNSWDTAGSGTVLEQSQVLTTHNLAVLVDALALQPRLEELATALAEQVLNWIVRVMAAPPPRAARPADCGQEHRVRLAAGRLPAVRLLIRRAAQAALAVHPAGAGARTAARPGRRAVHRDRANGRR
jgi:hypothetical protein